MKVKMEKIIVFIISIILLLAMTYCGDSNYSTNLQNSNGTKLTLVFLDSNQNPAANAKIDMYYIIRETKKETNYPTDNFPNPFSDTTFIQLDLKSEHKQLVLITLASDILGQDLDTVWMDYLPKGNNLFEYYPSNNLFPGIYYIKYKVEDELYYKELFYVGLNNQISSGILGINQYYRLISDANGKADYYYSGSYFLGKIFKKINRSGYNSDIIGNKEYSDSVALAINYSGIIYFDTIKINTNINDTFKIILK